MADVDYLIQWFQKLQNYEAKPTDNDVVHSLTSKFQKWDSQNFMFFIEHFQSTDGMWNNVINMVQFRNFIESIQDAGKRYEVEKFRWDAYVDRIAGIRQREKEDDEWDSADNFLKEMLARV